MNNKRRARLREATGLLRTASDIVSSAMDDEEEYADNMPENMQDGEKYDKAYEVAEMLSDADDLIGEAIDKIREASM